MKTSGRFREKWIFRGLYSTLILLSALMVADKVRFLNALIASPVVKGQQRTFDMRLCGNVFNK